MPDIGSAIGAGGSIIGGLIGSDASDDAADAASQASLAGVRENRRQFDTVLNLQAPAINTGNAARSMLASILGISQPAYSYAPGGSTGNTATGSGRTPSLRELAGMSRSEQARIYNDIRKDTQPVTTGGNTPLTFNQPASSPMSGQDITALLEKYPGYRFAVDEATKSAQALGSATGSLSGNVLSALGERVGGGIATPVFQDYLNRLSGLSGGAQTASNAASQGALQTGQLVAAGLQNAGDSRASGILGQAGTQIGTIGGILGGIGQAMGNRGGTYGGYGSPPYTPNPVGGGGYRYGP